MPKKSPTSPKKFRLVLPPDGTLLSWAGRLIVLLLGGGISYWVSENTRTLDSIASVNKSQWEALRNLDAALDEVKRDHVALRSRQDRIFDETLDQEDRLREMEKDCSRRK